MFEDHFKLYRLKETGCHKFPSVKALLTKPSQKIRCFVADNDMGESWRRNRFARDEEAFERD